MYSRYHTFYTTRKQIRKATLTLRAWALSPFSSTKAHFHTHIPHKPLDRTHQLLSPNSQPTNWFRHLVWQHLYRTKHKQSTLWSHLLLVTHTGTPLYLTNTLKNFLPTQPNFTTRQPYRAKSDDTWWTRKQAPPSTTLPTRRMDMLQNKHNDSNRIFYDKHIYSSITLTGTHHWTTPYANNSQHILTHQLRTQQQIVM